MNPEQFKDSPSGRVIQVGQGEIAYWSFVPNPLPPVLPFDSTLIRMLSNADRALRRLEQDQILKEITGKQRNRLYIAPEIMQFLQ